MFEPDVAVLAETDETLPTDVSTSQNPLDGSFWFGWADPRPLALFRILLGLAVLYALVARALAAGGLAAAGASSGTWWVLVVPSGAVVVALTLGYRTRLATFLAWGGLLALHHAGGSRVTDGADDLVRTLMFWAMFADLGACWSLDSRGNIRRAVPAFPLRILQAQIAVLYAAAAWFEFTHGRTGAGGLCGIVPGSTGSSWSSAVSVWLGTRPALCTAIAYGMLAMQAAFAVAAFSPVLIRTSRRLAVLLGLTVPLVFVVLLQAGVAAQAVMVAACALFVLPERYDVHEAWARLAMGVPLEETLPPESRPTWTDRLLAVALAAQFLLAAWVSFAGRAKAPELVQREVGVAGLEQRPLDAPPAGHPRDVE